MPNLRRDNTSAGFTSGNPVLAAGEHGYETDTEASKIGDGVTPWANLPYTGANPTRTALDSSYTPANPTLTVTYNSDGSVASTVENGVTTSFTYNTDGTVHTQTRAGVTRTFTYDATGNVTGAS